MRHRSPTCLVTLAVAVVTALAPTGADPAASAVSRPHFRTPQAAMRYLASAYNRHDLAALRHVTNPASRAALADMRSHAVDLRLDRCTRRPAGDYLCFFTHDFPERLHRSGHGHAEFIAAPVDSVGWYMYVFEDCD